MANSLSTSTRSLNAERDRATPIFLEELKKQKTLAIDSLIEIFISHEIDNPERLAKEIVWELAEKGTVKLNDDWLIELNA